MKNQLVEIIEKYKMNGFDEKWDSMGRSLGGWGTDKNDWHGYCDYYEEQLLPYQDREVNVLEIGSCFGCSAIMWHDFLPKSKILMLDIFDKLSPKCWDIMDNDRFTYANCDAYDTETIPEVKNLFPDGFDIIFDDGPHTLQSQKECLDYYLPLLKTGGSLFIEDVQSYEELEKLQEHFDGMVKTCDGEYSSELVDLRYVKDRYDDLIFAVKKIK